jgi:hypothetical protein
MPNYSREVSTAKSKPADEGTARMAEGWPLSLRSAQVFPGGGDESGEAVSADCAPWPTPTTTTLASNWWNYWPSMETSADCVPRLKLAIKIKKLPGS